MLADSVIAGLSSTENFSDAKSSLRQVTETQPPPLTESQRQLLPYKSIMLLHVKGMHICLSNRFPFCRPSVYRSFDLYSLKKKKQNKISAYVPAYVIHTFRDGRSSNKCQYIFLA